MIIYWHYNHYGFHTLLNQSYLLEHKQIKQCRVSNMLWCQSKTTVERFMSQIVEKNKIVFHPAMSPLITGRYWWDNYITVILPVADMIMYTWLPNTEQIIFQSEFLSLLLSDILHTTGNQSIHLIQNCALWLVFEHWTLFQSLYQTQMNYLRLTSLIFLNVPKKCWCFPPAVVWD